MATFAVQMVGKHRTLLADSAGLKTVTVDGQSVTYQDLDWPLEHWEGKAAEKKRWPHAASIKLSSGSWHA